MKLLIALAALLATEVAGVGGSSRGIPVDDLHTVGASPEVVDRLDWAAGRFVAAGLRLPPIELHVHEDDRGCDGADGRTSMSGEPIRIDICNPHRLILLHELAHAWDAVALSDSIRGAFMEAMGVEVWNDRSVPWKERGVERLAEVVVWGLHETGARDQRKQDAFSLLTGTDPLWIES